MEQLITDEWLKKVCGFEHDGYLYTKGRFYLAPRTTGEYDLFLNGLQGRITCTISYQYQLEDLYKIIKVGKRIDE